jgi:hypothetical protein
MDDQKFCEKHQKWYYPNQAWIHGSCAGSVRDDPGRKAENSGRLSGQDRKRVESPRVQSELAGSDLPRTANRRSRKAYNEYMKAYMRKKRNG